MTLEDAIAKERSGTVHSRRLTLVCVNEGSVLGSSLDGNEAPENKGGPDLTR